MDRNISRKIFNFIAAVFIITGLLLIFRQFVKTSEERYYESLSNSEKFKYVLDTYYPGINDFLEIPDEDILPKERIVIADVLNDPSYVGQYETASNMVTIRSDILKNLGYTVMVLTHEMNHYKQYLYQEDELFESSAMQDGNLLSHDKRPCEIESDRAGNLFVALQGLNYYNGRGCNIFEYFTYYLKGLVSRINH